MPQDLNKTQHHIVSGEESNNPPQDEQVAQPQKIHPAQGEEVEEYSSLSLQPTVLTQLSTSTSATTTRHSISSLHEVVELGENELENNNNESLIQILIDTINNDEENRKKRKRKESVEGHAEHVSGQPSIWDIIPQQFTNVKLHAGELPSTEFCKVMFLYAWAYSKYLAQEHAESNPPSPILSQDGSSDDSHVSEPLSKKMAYSK